MTAALHVRLRRCLCFMYERELLTGRLWEGEREAWTLISFSTGATVVLLLLLAEM